ncbi:MAG TPA: aryl-sulfate sulfotransferase [Bryobacteraceae bacterium]|nr:aryl-sulfate sulfotransferase [Bryobacteraceae bacterium]
MKTRFLSLSPAGACLVALASVTAGLQAAVSVSLTPSVPSPAPLGTVVTWSAAAFGDGPGPLWYRFRAAPAGTDLRVIQDYGPSATLDWTATNHDGPYEIEVTARDTSTGESAAMTAEFVMTSLVAGGVPAVTPTANPLVFLYSAPPCDVGSRMRVQFQVNDEPVQSTPFQPCVSGRSMNFYLAGMRPDTTYRVHHTVETASALEDGPALAVTTPTVSLHLPAIDILQPAPFGGILLHSRQGNPPFATDLAGNLLWYYTGKLNAVTRVQDGGYFYSLLGNANQSASLMREFDLAGNTVRETNVARINEQLAALGLHSIGTFSHEALGLPDGKVLVLATTERILTDVQGPGAVDVLGDMILALDPDLQVVWTWDAFDHLDPHRAATLGETCSKGVSGCPPLYLASTAQDWLHGNALQLTSDGNILFSARHQDWIIKIDFANGAGSGDVIWRLGKDGDFQMNSSDPNPWFSHQHGPYFAPGSDSILGVFDDGNLRQAVDANAHSRAQVLQLDQKNMTATLLVNADVGGFSFAMGNAEPLPNGNTFFGGGWLPDDSCNLFEFDRSGNLLYQAHVHAPEVRTFWMPDLYTAEAPAPGVDSVQRCRPGQRPLDWECRTYLQ